MDLPEIERALGACEARPLLADSRLVRRVIKQHRHLPGVGLQVPHARCYTIDRASLLAIASAEELGRAAADLPDHVILLPRPDSGEVGQRALPEILTHLWRYAFHARVHLEIDRLVAGGTLTPARIRERIHHIGQTEFDEIRLVLRHDRLLLPPYDDDRHTYAEFAALYLELGSFAPALLREVFPTLAGAGAAAEAIAEDLDAERLLEASRPAGAVRGHEPARTAAREPASNSVAPAPPGAVQADTLLSLAGAARAKGNVARSALLRVGAGAVSEARADVEALARRLDRALGRANEAQGAGIDTAAWAAVLLALAERARAGGGIFRRVEARLLYDVQQACIAGEKVIGTVDLVEWALSLGRRPIARLLPATRQIRVARQIERAARKATRVALPESEAVRLRDLLADARRRADETLRGELRPVVEETLRAVGLRPENVPERVALGKIVDELLDQATAHGHLNLGILRDAIARNQLKMADVSGPAEILGADALLAADRRLADAIDGVHRSGEIYLRALQKLSSLLFGTPAGRALTLYVVLPVGGGYMLPYAVGLIVTEVAHLLGIWHHHQKLDLVPAPWELSSASPADLILFPITAVLLFGLLHSAAVRAWSLEVLRAVGLVLAAIFVHVPRWIASRPLVQRVLRSRAAIALGRFVIKPGVVAAAVAATPLHRWLHVPPTVIAGAAFVVADVGINSRAGVIFEEVVSDGLAYGFRQLRRNVLPGIYRLVASAFRWLTDALDRGLYTVDEWLRFERGQRSGLLAGKAVLGVLWFAVAYLLRIFVNLFLEPTFNPIKHVPTVTVAAKILWPTLGPVVDDAFKARFGHLRAHTLTAVVMSILPGFFGFLVWELKENYKLYRRTRAATLRPVPIGHHGETMGALLKPGFHSGTLPKLWAKLRRAARKGDSAVEKHREALREIEEAVERFVDRELAALLRESDRWEGEVHVVRVELASNRVRVELGRGGHHAQEPDACVLAFEEQSGWICAGVARAGWVAALSGDERVLFENALGGLYHRAGVDLVREQIEAALPATSKYDIADEGLVVWPAGWATELVYDLAARHAGALEARVRGAPAGQAPPPIDRAAILFRARGITWSDWVAAWSGAPKRVVKGASLLPCDGERNTARAV